MLVRTTKAQLQTGQIEEFALRWQEHVAPHEIHDRATFRDRVRDILGGEPAAEEYEVLAQS